MFFLELTQPPAPCSPSSRCFGHVLSYKSLAPLAVTPHPCLRCHVIRAGWQALPPGWPGAPGAAHRSTHGTARAALHPQSGESYHTSPVATAACAPGGMCTCTHTNCNLRTCHQCKAPSLTQAWLLACYACLLNISSSSQDGGTYYCPTALASSLCGGGAAAAAALSPGGLAASGGGGGYVIVETNFRVRGQPWVGWESDAGSWKQCHSLDSAYLSVMGAAWPWGLRCAACPATQQADTRSVAANGHPTAPAPPPPRRGRSTPTPAPASRCACLRSFAGWTAPCPTSLWAP